MQMRVKLNQLSWGEVRIIRDLISLQLRSLVKIKESLGEHAKRACQESEIELEMFYERLEDKITILGDLKDHPDQLFNMLSHEDLSTLRHILTQENKKYQRKYPDELKMIKVKFSTFRGLIQTVNLN